jgi:hypothetical protein
VSDAPRARRNGAGRWPIPSASGSGAVAERMVFGLALCELLVLALGLVLGATRLLTPEYDSVLAWSAAFH